ncbi:hypothetical protein DBR47_17115 [Paucibacter sp. KBW04]|uniref:FIST signal transduction protein n=1 Tax=Paucibacter sp. KBW04 TaxID=2153361 RepID=UPI000F563493|nr:FIST N-terminal domain-containing protein [Paucibacter sp. KBW04]RQO56263.1 hypothetical protein DBR47_17115 [Paucibacter sp. KBW04]
MKVAQVILRESQDLRAGLLPLQALAPDLLLVFAPAGLLQAINSPLTELFPHAARAGCTTAGEISNEGVSDQSCVVTALHFEQGTRVLESSARLLDMADSQDAGHLMGSQLPKTDLRAVLVLGQGVEINGSAMIQGLTQALGAHIPLVGGLAGDAAAFKETWVLGSAGVRKDQLVCLGFYGPRLSFSHGSFGGWSPFGPARKVTRAENNVLFELDGEPALEIYKRYLGDYAKDLPASGLLFPFAMLGSDHNEVGLIRTILGVDEAAGSMTLAGDIDPEGYLRLMHASTDALVEGAESAAMAAQQMETLRASAAGGDSLVLLVSCVGRKLVMGGRVDEEVEAVGDVFKQGATLAGFYSYGEISPFVGSSNCKLHNQTMTITHLAET